MQSVLDSSIIVWFGRATTKFISSLNSLIGTAERITGAELPRLNPWIMKECQELYQAEPRRGSPSSLSDSNASDWTSVLSGNITASSAKLRSLIRIAPNDTPRPYLSNTAQHMVHANVEVCFDKNSSLTYTIRQEWVLGKLPLEVVWGGVTTLHSTLCTRCASTSQMWNWRALVVSRGGPGFCRAHLGAPSQTPSGDPHRCQHSSAEDTQTLCEVSER